MARQKITEGGRKMKVCYKIKKGMKDKIRKIIRFNKLAEKVGINECYMSEIVNGRRESISKSLAYMICKAISPDLEINDVFDVTIKK